MPEDKHWDEAGNCRTCGECGRCTCPHHKIKCAKCNKLVHATKIQVVNNQNVCASCETIMPARERYPELYNLARELGREVAQKINERAWRVRADTPYKAQGTLEMLIDILQEAV